MLLSVIAKNLNWETLTRIYLLLKDGTGLKMENLKEWSQKKTIYSGGLGQFAGLREGT